MALCALLPQCTYLPLTISSINSGVWAPKKDYNTGRLVRGGLQLAAGTVLLVDETGMDAGDIQEPGVKNLMVRDCGRQMMEVRHRVC